MAELNVLRNLDAKIATTRARLARLAFVRAFTPLLIFSAVFLLAALLGLFQSLSESLAAGTSLGSLLVWLLLLSYGLRQWQRPSIEESRRALDAESPLRPVSGLIDRSSTPTPAAEALWRAHSLKLNAAAAALKPPRFRDMWRRIDPIALRFIVPTVLVGLLILVGQERGPRLQAAFQPDFGALVGADSLRVEAWITPPAHTGRPPVFLTTDMDEVHVPAGSEITLRAFNRTAPELVILGARQRLRQRFEDSGDGAFEAKAILEATGHVSVRWWGERAHWSIIAADDLPPSVEFVTLPSLTTDDEMAFDWAIEDDFGVASLELAIRLREPHPAAPDAEDRLIVPLGGQSIKQAEESALLDTMRHRWAGLPVDVTLVATDGAGQSSRSVTYPFILPEKLLLQPLAKAAQEIRVSVLREPRPYAALEANPEGLTPGQINTAPTRRLASAPPDVQRAAEMLDALTLEAGRYFEDRSVYLGMRMAHSVLQAAPDKAEADSIDNLLWAVALKAEYGSAADALRALLAARRALEQALRDGASEDEIRRLMEAFREAANNYIAAKMAEAMMNGSAAPNMSDMGEAGGGEGLGASDFQDMLDALGDLAETGATDQARQLLSDITNMLENLEFQQGGAGGEDGFAMPGGQGGESEENEDLPEEERELTDALEALSDLLREQRELNDDTLAERRGEGPSNPSGEPGQGGPGEAGEEATEQQGLGARQRALSEQAQRLAEGLGLGDGEDGEAPGTGDDGETGTGEGLDEAARQRLDDIARLQEKAARDLEGNGGFRAERLQENATRGLRDLSAELAAELDALQAARLGEDGQQRDDAVDPLGRAIGGSGTGEDVQIPDAGERQRAKDILDELRRRYDETEDADERLYLERLLDRF